MPFHHAPVRAARPVRIGLLCQYRQWLPSRQNFHASPPLRDDIDSSKNHYEILNVRTDASHAEIKKSVSPPPQHSLPHSYTTPYPTSSTSYPPFYLSPPSHISPFH
jgi:hypothetical protein